VCHAPAPVASEQAGGQQDQSSVVHVPKYDYEIHKLKLKIVSLESQNDFLVQKNKTLEHQVST
jgi:hypothetical protein